MDACVSRLSRTEKAPLDLSHASSSNENAHETHASLSVIDIACGNLRFEKFLAKNYPHVDFGFYAIDNCEPLVHSREETAETYNVAAPNSKVFFACEDVIGRLIKGLPFYGVEPTNSFNKDSFDLGVSFGFMHHVPGFDTRVLFLKEALGLVKPGGYLVVSFWQFMNDETKAEKTRATHQDAIEYLRSIEPSFKQEELEENDYLLGWKNLPDQYRYCHHFSDEEIKALIASIADKARLVDRFSADGKSGKLNCYVVLQRT